MNFSSLSSHLPMIKLHFLYPYGLIPNATMGHVSLTATGEERVTAKLQKGAEIEKTADLGLRQKDSNAQLQSEFSALK